MNRKLLIFPDMAPYGPLGWGKGGWVGMMQKTFTPTARRKGLSGGVLLYPQSARGTQEREQSVLFEVLGDLGKLLREGSL